MKNIARNLVLVGCIGSSVTAAPFLAIGDNAELFAVADASVAYNDNILLSDSSNELDDVIFTFRPGFDLDFGKDSLLKGSFFLNSTLTSYTDNDELNNQLLGVGTRLNYDTGGPLSLAANASYNELDQAVVDTSLLTGVRGTVLDRAVTAAGVNGEFRYSEKISIGAGVAFNKVDYKSGNSVEQEDFSVPVNVYYELTPKVDLSSGVTYKHSELDGVLAGLSDEYDDFYYNVGARGEFTPKLSGSFTVGYTVRDGNRGNDDDGSLGTTAALSYAYSEKTQLNLSASRDFANATSNGESFENTNVTLSAVSAITVDWRLNASATYRMLDYDDYTNDYIEGSVGAGYTINEHLTANAGYTYRKQLSDRGDAFEFENNLISVSISARY